MKVFEYVIVHQPKNKEGVIVGATIVAGPKVILAADQRGAEFQAARAVPDTHADKYEELVVAVRPF